MTADRENFILLPSNMDPNNYTRPLSAYDNLHSTSAHSPAVTIPTQQKPNHSNGNEKEFPFNSISFRFDDLPQNQPNFNQNRSNSTIPISNSSNCNNGNLNKSTSQGYPTIANHNGNKTAPIPPVVNNVDSDSNMLLGATKQQYENVSETVRLRNLNLRNSNKPVISEAKSSFFGLNAPSPINTKETMALRHNNQPSDNGGYEDCSPLINSSSSSATRNLYQNIPSNSACFDSGTPTFNDVDHNAVDNRKNINDATARRESSSDCGEDFPQNNNSSKYFADASHRMSQSPSQVCRVDSFLFVL